MISFFVLTLTSFSAVLKPGQTGQKPKC